MNLKRPKSHYGKTKFIFLKKIIKLAKKFKCSCTILRLFPIYGINEPKHRLYPSIISSIKNSKNFVLKNGNQINDYSRIDNVARQIYEYLNSNLKKIILKKFGI